MVKATLAGTTNTGMGDLDGAGAGLLDAKRALNATSHHLFDLQPANQGIPPSTGSGSLEGSRGNVRVLSDFDGDGIDNKIAGEMDPLGNSWDGNSWDGNSWDGNSWASYISVAGGWGGNSESGSTWDGTSWDQSFWEGNSWDGNSWDGNSWDGNSWDGNSWDGNSWDGRVWDGRV